MPGSTRLLPSGAAKQIVRTALVNTGAERGGRSPSQVARNAGPHRDTANVTTTLDALVSDGDATVNTGLYTLTPQGIAAFRLHPAPRARYSS